MFNDGAQMYRGVLNVLIVRNFIFKIMYVHTGKIFLHTYNKEELHIIKLYIIKRKCSYRTREDVKILSFECLYSKFRKSFSQPTQCERKTTLDQPMTFLYTILLALCLQASCTLCASPKAAGVFAFSQFFITSTHHMHLHDALVSVFLQLSF